MRWGAARFHSGGGGVRIIAHLVTVRPARFVSTPWPLLGHPPGLRPPGASPRPGRRLGSSRRFCGRVAARPDDTDCLRVPKGASTGSPRGITVEPAPTLSFPPWGSAWARLCPQRQPMPAPAPPPRSTESLMYPRDGLGMGTAATGTFLGGTQAERALGLGPVLVRLTTTRRLARSDVLGRCPLSARGHRFGVLGPRRMGAAPSLACHPQRMPGASAKMRSIDHT